MPRRTRAFVSVACATFLLASCAWWSDTHNAEREQTLAAAGFKIVPADTPDKLAKLNALPQRQFVTRARDGQTYFLYADAAGCQCLYIGTNKQYDAYQKLQQQKEIAFANEQAAADQTQNEEFMYNMWGYPGWWTPY